MYTLKRDTLSPDPFPFAPHGICALLNNPLKYHDPFASMRVEVPATRAYSWKPAVGYEKQCKIPHWTQVKLS